MFIEHHFPWNFQFVHDYWTLPYAACFQKSCTTILTYGFNDTSLNGLYKEHVGDFSRNPTYWNEDSSLWLGRCIYGSVFIAPASTRYEAPDDVIACENWVQSNAIAYGELSVDESEWMENGQIVDVIAKCACEIQALFGYVGEETSEFDGEEFFLSDSDWLEGHEVYWSWNETYFLSKGEDDGVYTSLDY